MLHVQSAVLDDLNFRYVIKPQNIYSKQYTSKILK